MGVGGTGVKVGVDVGGAVGGTVVGEVAGTGVALGVVQETSSTARPRTSQAYLIFIFPPVSMVGAPYRIPAAPMDH